jgi:outer membrane immunogenic protein
MALIDSLCLGLAMKRLLLSTASVALIVGQSHAADLPSIKSAPVTASAPIWTGFYAGLNAGGSWENSNSVHFSNFPAYANPVLKSAPYQMAIISIFGNENVSTSNHLGFIGGGQIGYNHQAYEKVIFGVETDIQGITGQGGGTTSSYNVLKYTYTATATGSVTPATAYTLYAASKSVDYVGTVRGKIGYLATPNIELYGTGGLAYGGVRTRSFSWQQLSIPSTDEIGPGSSSYDGTKVGWTAGGGIEWMFSSNWSVKAEYLYYDLGSVNTYNGQLVRVWNNHQTVSGITAGDIACTSVSQSKVSFNGNIARAGVNYHFNIGSTPVVAKY